MFQRHGIARRISTRDATRYHGNVPYPLDAQMRASTLSLLGSIWKKLPQGIARARSWGADWCDWSEPFVHVENGEVVAHVGVMEIAVTLDGRARTLAGIHAVCTHPAHRGRGLLRATLTRALAWVDARYDTAVLWANDREIYRRFGFVAHAESVFTMAVAAPSPAASSSPRQLSLDDPADVRLLRDRLAARAPVSRRCGSREPGWLALVDLALSPAPGPTLARLPELDSVVAYVMEGRTLLLHDVIAPRMPSLAALVPLLGVDADAVRVFFSPDDLGAAALAAGPTPLDDFLMVRGAPLLDRNEPFAFSPLTRC